MIITPNMILGGLQLLDTLLGGSSAQQPRQPAASPSSSQLTFKQAMQAARQGTGPSGLQITVGTTHVQTAGDRELRLRL